jgi:sulfatase modifying factor 1
MREKTDMASQTTLPRQVFISHATQDADFAHRLADGLKQLGVPVWIAPDSIRPGESWVDAIERGLEESSHMLVVLTPAAVESSWVKKETNVAIALERKGRVQILPLDVQACDVPLLLSSYQMVSFRQDYDTGFTKLVGVLGLSVPPPGAVSPPHEGPQSRPKAQVARPTTSERPQPSEQVAQVALAKPKVEDTRPEQQPKAEVALPTILKPSKHFEPEMVFIPAGEFLMGSDPKKDKDAKEDEQPQHRLYLPDYHIAKTPVTNAQYLAFVQATNHRAPGHWKGKKPPQGKEDYPVVNVTWEDAVDYCEWLTKRPRLAMLQQGGRGLHWELRLPSEAEWEKAARGTDGRIYPWGNEWDAGRCNTEEGGVGDTTPVGAYPQGASPYGVLDMAGNVWEWTRNQWGKDWEKPESKYPYEPRDGREKRLRMDFLTLRVLRGGAFDINARGVRCAFRSRMSPILKQGTVGFRIVLASGIWW